MKRYKKYKDSGIDWIGEIPSHWNVKRLKYLTTPKKEKSDDGSEELLSVSEYIGVVPRSILRKGEDHLTRSESLKGYLKVSKGNLVNNIMLMWKKGLGVSDYEGIVSPAYSVFDFNDFIPKYFHYLLRTDLYIAEYRKNSTGIIDSRLRLYDDDFGYIFSYLPPLPEQKQIVSFLDNKTRIIDKLIEKTEKKIELLKEKRTALVNHCVTKGLPQEGKNEGIKKLSNEVIKKYKKYKNSAVEWIGEIPRHWEIKKLKFCDRVIMGQSPKSEDYNEKKIGLPFLQGNADFSELYPNPRIYCDKANKKAVKKDILLSVRAPIGAVNIANQEFGIGRGLCAIRSINTLNQLLFFIIVSLKDELNRVGTGSTYKAISIEDIENVYIPNPPLPEQKQIVKYLDTQTQKIDTAIEKETKRIELLKEYRQSIISEVVTGKIDLSADRQV